jgi:hypothetical protein
VDELHLHEDVKGVTPQMLNCPLLSAGVRCVPLVASRPEALAIGPSRWATTRM